MSDKKNLKVLSLFSGCGGMDLGFEGGFDVLAKSVNPNIYPEWLRGNRGGAWARLPETGFSTIFANDIFPAAKAAWTPFFAARGKPKDAFHLESVVELVKKHRKTGGVFPEADVVTGGFPCQDFSIAGKKDGFNSHKAHHGKPLSEIDDATEENRGKLYMWMKRVVEMTLPKVFVAENVKGLVSLADAKGIIENDFRTVGPGYLVVDAKVLRAPDFGVPQSRERVIFIGFREDALDKDAAKALARANIPDEFNPYPVPTHAAAPDGDGRPPYVTAGDCLLDLPEPEDSDDPSQRSYSKAKWYGSHCQGQTEINLSGLAPTIRSEHHGNIEFRRLSAEHGGKHAEELGRGLRERRLTVRECARIQTFPDDFEFVRKAGDLGAEYKISASEGYRLVGNAVPPLLAFHIAWRLRELWPKIMK